MNFFGKAENDVDQMGRKLEDVNQKQNEQLDRIRVRPIFGSYSKGNCQHWWYYENVIKLGNILMI